MCFLVMILNVKAVFVYFTLVLTLYVQIFHKKYLPELKFFVSVSLKHSHTLS